MSSDVVVDTDVLSFLFKSDTRADLYRPHLVGRRPAISFMTLAELLRWPLANGWGAGRRRRLELYVSRFVVHGYDEDLCRVWAEVTDTARRSGRAIQCADAWIAATALLHVNGGGRIPIVAV